MLSRRRILILATVTALLLLCMGGAIGATYLRNVQLPQGAIRLRGNHWHVSSMAFSKDGTKLMTVGWDCRIRVIDVASGKPLQEWWGPQRPQVDVALAPGTDEIAVSSDGVWLTRWNIATGSLNRRLLYPPVAGGHLCYSPDGRYLAASGMAGGNVVVWNRDGQPHLILGGHRGYAGAIAFSPEGKTLATIDQSAVHLWDVASGKHLRSLDVPNATFVRFSGDGKLLAYGGTYTPLHIVERDTYRSRAVVSDRVIQRAIFTPNSQSLIVASDGDLLIYDTFGKLLCNAAPSRYPPGFLMRAIPPLRRLKRLPISNLVFSPNGQTFAYSFGEMVVVQSTPSLKLP